MKIVVVSFSYSKIFLRVQLKEDNLTLPKEIKLAEYAGFCYGVKRAVDTVLKLRKDNPNKKVYILGELIHNSQVIDDLAKQGIETVDDIPDCDCGYCVIRSHGEAPYVFDEIKNAGLEAIDLTCPDVKKVQQKAIELVKNGYYLVILGKHSHPEVIAINANARQYSDKVVVANSVEELKSIEQELKSHKKIGVVVQTTQTFESLAQMVEYLTPIAKELLIANTICRSTSMRQQEAVELAKECDLMIVVGSKKSANTTHLAEICAELTQTIHIETAEELKVSIPVLKSFDSIGVTAGASTPQNVIDEVMRILNRIKD